MKKILTAFSISLLIYVIILTICCGSVVTTVHAEQADDITSKSAVLMDYYSGEVLMKKDEHKKAPVASMVKMMTILLTLEELEKGELQLSDMVTTSEVKCSLTLMLNIRLKIC